MKSTAHPGGRCIGLQANCKWERMLRSEDRAGDIGREIISVEGVIESPKTPGGKSTSNTHFQLAENCHHL